MSLYSSNIQFLPRPPRNFFSIGSEQTRATLPDFATVQDLSQFTNRLFNWHFTVPAFYAQTVTICCFHFLLFIFISSIMARRFQEGKFWLIRVIQRRSGTIIVPNPMLAFLSMAGIYEVVFIPFLLWGGRQFELHTGPPNGIVLWFTLPWLSLAFGMIGAVIGTYFATPDSILDENQASSSLKRFFGQAKIINSLSLLGPIVLTATIVTPSILCNQQWYKAIEMEKNWQSKYSSLSSFTPEMVHESQLIWYQAMKVHHLASIIFIIWTIFAFTMSTAYCFVTYRLAVAVRQDLNIVKREYSLGRQTMMIASSVSSPSTLICGATTTSTVSPMAIQQAAAADTTTSLHDIQKNTKNLEQALFHIYIQLLAVAPAAAGLGAIALALALTLFSKLEQQPNLNGGNQFEPCVSGLWLGMIYLIAVAGGFNVLSVAYKTYEPVFSAARQSRLMNTTSQIQIQDILKGKDHIKSTFFQGRRNSMESLSISSPMMFTASNKEHHQRSQSTLDNTLFEETEMTDMDNSTSTVRTWDIEAKADWF